MNTSKTPEVSTTAAETPATSQAETLMRRPDSRRHLWVAAFLGIALSAVLVTVLIATVLRKREPSHSEDHLEQFCCPEEALMVIRVLNSSIDPCDDFYGHVCSKADAGASEYISPFFRTAMLWNFIDTAGIGTSRSASGAMLASLKNGFWASQESPANGVAQYLVAIMQAGIPSLPLDSSEVVRILALLNIRYGLPTVITFSVSQQGTDLNLMTSECFSDPDLEVLLPSVLDIVNRALNSSVTSQEFLSTKDHVASLLGRNGSGNISNTIESSPFSFLSKRAWMDIVEALVFPLYPNVTTVVTAEQKRLNDLMDILANNTRLSVGIAYIAMCTALMTRGAMEAAARTNGMTLMSPPCHALGFCEIEEAFMAEMVSSRRMNGHLRDIFAKMISNVAHDASGHPLLKSTTEAELMRRLHTLRLVLPEEITISDIPVPAVLKTFPANLLAARSYAFDVKAAKVARKIPDTESLFFPVAVRNGYSVFVPTNLYALLSSSPRRSDAVDLSALGVDFATHLWSFLLESPWSREIRRNIDNRLECFRKTYFNGSNTGDYLTTATTALGVVSAFGAMRSSDWNVVGHLNHTDISVEHLVYFMWAYNKCAALPVKRTPLNVNLALKSSRLFREAFRCILPSPVGCCLEAC